MPPLALMVLLLAAGPPEKSAHWLDVPFIPQTENGCGAACLAMVLKYWQPEAAVETPEMILRDLFDPKTKGIPAVRMEQYFRLRGYKVYAFRGKWEDLIQHLARGRPLIASLRPSGSQAHYVVVAGIDPPGQLVQLNDPARGKLTKVRRNDFERAWRACDSWTLLALPNAP